jgi:hypothetical protein
MIIHKRMTTAGYACFSVEQVCVSVVLKPCSAGRGNPDGLIKDFKTMITKIIKNPNRNGRPPKEKSEKKQYKVTVKMATDEYFSMKTKARLANITQSEYVRKAIQKSEVIQRLSPEHLLYVRQISGMANNLNQLAKHANIEGFAEARLDCRNMINNLDNLIKRIFE